MRTMVLTRQEVCTLTTLSKSSLYELIRLGHFPRPIKLPSVNRVVWDARAVEETINGWLESDRGCQ